MNVNLSSRSLLDAYNQVLSGDPNTSWTIFTYDRGTNDLKVDQSGQGGLEDVADEFRDGRIQYAFIRVTDPNSELPKFVQINWCGDGVPEGKKGLFHNHSNTVARFFKAAHIQINARNESDVDPAVILKRLADAGGSKYSVQANQSAPSHQPTKIAAVGSSYVPTGKIDMNALKSTGSGRVQPSTTPAPAPAPKPFSYGSSAPAPAPIKKDEGGWGNEPPAPTPAPKPFSSGSSAPAPIKKDDGGWGDEPPAAPAPRANPGSFGPSVGKSAGFGSSASSNAGSFYKPPTAASAQPKVTPAARAPETAKSAGEDKIGPVGTAYTPVSLPAPKKLVNRWGAQAQAQESSTPSATTTTGGDKKLTWTERQALAKERDVQEDLVSQTALSTTTTSQPPRALPPRSVSPRPTSDKADSDDGFEEPAPAPATRTFLPPRVPPRPKSDKADSDDGFEEPAPAPAARSFLPPRLPPAPKQEEEAEDSDGFEEPTPAPAARSFLPPRLPPTTQPEEEEEEKVAEPTRSVPPPFKANQPPAFPSDDEFASDEEPEPAKTVFEGIKAAVVGTTESGLAVLEGIKETLVGPSEPAKEAEVEKTEGKLKARALFDYEPTEDNELGFKEGDVLEEVERVDEGWWSGSLDGNVGLFPANYVELLEDDETVHPVEQKPAAVAESIKVEPTSAAAVVEEDVQPVHSHHEEEERPKGIVAVALYDYEAAESNELTFKEGDRIVEIQEASEDWWSGKGVDGSEGLFPANYVEVQQ